MENRYIIEKGSVVSAAVCIDEDGVVFIVPPGSRSLARMGTLGDVFHTEREALEALKQQRGRKLWCVIGVRYGKSVPVVVREWCVPMGDHRVHPNTFVIVNEKSEYNEAKCRVFETKEGALECALECALEMLQDRSQAVFNFALQRGAALREYQEEVARIKRRQRQLSTLKRQLKAAGMKTFTPKKRTGKK